MLVVKLPIVIIISTATPPNVITEYAPTTTGCDAIKPEYSTTPPYFDERVLMKGQKEGAEDRSELEGV